MNIVNPYRHGTVTPPTGGGYDPDYQAVLDAVANGGDPLPSTQQQDIDNQLMLDMKASGYYDKRDLILKASGTATPDFKLYCWKRKIKMVANGGLIWEEDGVKPNGSDAFVDLLYDGATSDKYLLNDAGIDWVQEEAYASGGYAITGGFSGPTTNYTLIAPQFSGSAGYPNINGSNGTIAPYGRLGYNAVNRISATQLKVQDTTTVNQNSNTKWGYPLFLFARNRVDIGAKDLFYNRKVSFFSIGGSVFNEYATIKTILE